MRWRERKCVSLYQSEEEKCHCQEIDKDIFLYSSENSSGREVITQRGKREKVFVRMSDDLQKFPCLSLSREISLVVKHAWQDRSDKEIRSAVMTRRRRERERAKEIIVTLVFFCYSFVCFSSASFSLSLLLSPPPSLSSWQIILSDFSCVIVRSLHLSPSLSRSHRTVGSLAAFNKINDEWNSA